MKRAAALGIALALAGCAGGQGSPRDRYDRLLTATANPSEVVAAELAFAREAQEKGQWTAFRKYATDDAVIFVPEAVNAQSWLKKQTNPGEAVKWQPHHVWSSCDGTLAVTKGAWQRPDGSTGYFTTVWQRQSKSGTYRWVMDQGDKLDTPLVEPEFIGTTVASCNGDPASVVTMQLVEGTPVGGKSRDGTLEWSVTVRPDSTRRVLISYWDGETWQSPISVDAAP